jgi:ABC-type glycerol-3-phosphate transport system substrate-binding protein
VRRLLLTVLVAGLALAGCGGDDGGETADPDPSTTTTSAAGETTTTTTTPRPVDTTFATEDVEAVCADLEGLSDIDPDADPSQAQVDRLMAIAETAPPGVADPLRDVAAFGQLAVDAGPTFDSLPDDAEAIQAAAIEGATLLIAYGNEACAIDVALFDTIAGV